MARLAMMVAAVACVLGAGGCHGADAPSPTGDVSSTPSATVSAPTTTRATTLTAAERDRRAAEATISRYWVVRDQLAVQPTKSLNAVATVARDQAAAQSRIILSTYRAKGWKQTGATAVVAPVGRTQNGTTFTVIACVDVSHVDFVNTTGKSVTNPARPDRQQYTYTVLKAPQGFFVTVDTLKGTACRGA